MLPEGGWPLVAVRGLVDAAMLSLFGALVVRAFIAPAGLRIARWSAVAALVLLPVWLAGQAVNLGGSLSAVPAVLGTAFGRQVAGSAACVLAALLAAGPGWRLALALPAAAGALVMQAGHSHAWAMQPDANPLVVSSTLHLLAAGAWLGGLLPLRAAVMGASVPGAVRAARRFSILGIGCVAVMAGTAVWQSSTLVGGLAGWVGTTYGHITMAKAALFAVLIGIAVWNRQWLTPALAAGDALAGQPAKDALARSIAAETGVGLAVVAMAALLTSVEPAMHLQPDWPFAVQPSLVTMDEAPELWWEAGPALAVMAGAVALLAVALFWRRGRLAAGALAGVAAWFAVPHLDLLFVPAYPTSFYHSPSGFAAQSIARGAAVFGQNCTGCHGVDGRGDGPLAASLPMPPANLTAGHLWMHPDGELFWWLSHGIEAPEGGLAMPGFAAALPADDLWALIDYVRAHNAGLHYAAMGMWSPPMRAPEIIADCPGHGEVPLAAMRGQVVRIVFPAGALRAADVAGAVTITDGGANGCTDTDPAMQLAYAVLLGQRADMLPGQAILIDANGWLRAVQPAQMPPALLAAAVQDIERTPLAQTSEGHHHHGG